MQTLADQIIDALGGTTAVHRMTQTPISTVHSWRRNGIPRARLAHLKLAAQVAGKVIDWDDPAEPARDGDKHGSADSVTQHDASSGKGAEVSAAAGAA